MKEKRIIPDINVSHEFSGRNDILKMNSASSADDARSGNCMFKDKISRGIFG